MVNNSKLLTGLGTMLAAGGIYWLYNKGYTPQSLDTITDTLAAVINYPFQMNFSSLQFYNWLAYACLGIGGYKAVKALGEKE